MKNSTEVYREIRSVLNERRRVKKRVLVKFNIKDVYRIIELDEKLPTLLWVIK